MTLSTLLAWDFPICVHKADLKTPFTANFTCGFTIKFVSLKDLHYLLCFLVLRKPNSCMWCSTIIPYNSLLFTIAMATAPGDNHTGAMLWGFFFFFCISGLMPSGIVHSHYRPGYGFTSAAVFPQSVCMLLCCETHLFLSAGMIQFFSEKDKRGALYPPP